MDEEQEPTEDGRVVSWVVEFRTPIPTPEAVRHRLEQVMLAARAQSRARTRRERDGGHSSE
jgi:hypothetical protein